MTVVEEKDLQSVKTDFEGIQGRVACIARQQRVIVELFSGYLVGVYTERDNEIFT